jgi:hypothetical protein
MNPNGSVSRISHYETQNLVRRHRSGNEYEKGLSSMNTIGPTAAQARTLPNGNAGIAGRATEAKLVDPRFSLYKSTEGYPMFWRNWMSRLSPVTFAPDSA